MPKTCGKCGSEILTLGPCLVCDDKPFGELFSLVWTLTEKSSNISSIAIQDKDLLVKFRNGSVYRYPGKANEYTKLLESESIGKYFHANIKNCEFIKVK
jgi:hypothetical protein